MKVGDVFESVDEVRKKLTSGQGVVVVSSDSGVKVYGDPLVKDHPNDQETLNMNMSGARVCHPGCKVILVTSL